MKTTIDVPDSGVLTVTTDAGGVILNSREVRCDGERFTTFLTLDREATRKLFLALAEALDP